MGMSGFNLVEMGHLVTLWAPDNPASTMSSDVFTFRNYSHASIIVVSGTGSASTVQVEECTGFGGTGAATRVFSYTQDDTGNSDIQDAALTAAGTAGIAFGTTTGTTIIIEIDADELTDGYPYLRIKTSSVTNSDFCALAILSGSRYQQDITPTEIA